MARLKQKSNGLEHQLTAEFSVGRGSESSLRLEDPMVSGRHAIVRWSGTGWTLRDLASTNGTFLDGKPVGAGRTVDLVKGSRVAFGNEHEVFVLLDSTPPQARARSENGQEVVSDHGMLMLPDSENPDVMVFLSESGTWLAEYGDGTREPVRPGSEIRVNGQTWQLSVPTVLAPTVQSADALFNLHSSTLRFHVSCNEETVSVELLHRDQRRTLDARTHLYVILTLARARLADQADPTIQVSEHGWRDIEELLDQLKIDESHFNVAIFRARRQFAKADVPGATELVERRKGERKIRIGAANIEILQ